MNYLSQGTSRSLPAVEFMRVNIAPAGRSEQAFTLSGSLGILQDHKWVFCLAFFMMLAAVIAIALFSPPKYEAEMKLYMSRSRVDIPVTGERNVTDSASGGFSDSEITAEMELIRSRELLEKTVLECGLVRLDGVSPQERGNRLARAVQKLERALRVAPIRKTSLISVKYTAGDQQEAASVLNTLANLYLDKHTAVHRNPDTSAFFSAQAKRYQAELSQAQRQLEDFAMRRNTHLLEAEKQAKLTRITELDRLLKENEAQIRDSEQRIQLLRKQQDALPATISTQSRMARNEPLMDKLKSLLMELEHKKTELLTKYDPSYRLVVEIDKQIRDTSAAIEREQKATVVERTEGLNTIRQSVEGDLLRTEALVEGARARQSGIAKVLKQAQARQNELSQITAEHNDLQRQVKLAEENYLLYKKKQEESRIADAMDRQRILNVSILEKAVPPALPVDSHLLFLFVMGLVVASFTGAGAVFAADLLDRRVRSEGDLAAAIDLPVLASVSRVQVYSGAR